MKKAATLFCLLAASAICFFAGCTKTSADQQTGARPPGAADCDTTGMKYTTDVVPILATQCFGCHGHGNTSGSGGISLDSYDDLKKYADNGFLKGNITHASGFVGMPYGLPKMDDCTINKILDWINQGSPNN